MHPLLQGPEVCKAGQKEGIKVAGNSIVYCLTGQEEEEALYWCIANGFFFVWVAVDRFAGDLGQCGVAWVVGIEERQATGTRTRQLSEPAIVSSFSVSYDLASRSSKYLVDV